MEKCNCPYCNFPGHAVAQKEGSYWSYVCERCHKIFVVDTKTGRPV